VCCQIPEQLLAERFGRGEINEEEYRHRLAVLRGEGQPADGQARPRAGTSTR
jgi:putative membrane protein